MAARKHKLSWKGKSLQERMERLTERQPNGCWIWQGSFDGVGYGVLTFGLKRKGAHRWAYELATGVTLGRWDYICHKCDTRACVNPDHLFLGDARANMLDCISKGRHNYGHVAGSRHGNTNLTEDDVRKIRSLYRIDRQDYSAQDTKSGRFVRRGKYTQKELADMFGTGITAINLIVNGYSWLHVQN